MAPVEATIALSHQEGITDSARARELYKYVSLHLTDVFQHSWPCFHNTDKAPLQILPTQRSHQR